jgi:hypothetical protein
VTYRQQTGATLRALAGGRQVAEVVLLTALAAAAGQVVFEFGPLWLVARHAPAALYGPYWAVLVATVGFGAWCASRARLDRPLAATGVGAVFLTSALVPNISSALPIVIAAQVVVALATAMIGVRAGFLLHEAVSANVRAGVSSGASTLSWLIFLPVSLLFGWIAREHGVMVAGWLLVGLAAAAAVLLIRASRFGSSVAVVEAAAEVAGTPMAPIHVAV